MMATKPSTPAAEKATTTTTTTTNGRSDGGSKNKKIKTKGRSNRRRSKTSTRWCVKCELEVPRTQFSNTQLKNRKAKCRSCCSHSRRVQEGELVVEEPRHDKNDVDQQTAKNLARRRSDKSKPTSKGKTTATTTTTTKSLSSFLDSAEEVNKKTSTSAQQQQSTGEMDESVISTTSSGGYTDTLTEATGSVVSSAYGARVGVSSNIISSLSLPSHVGSSMAKVEMRRLIQKYGFDVVEEAFWNAKEKQMSAVAAIANANTTEGTSSSPGRRSRGRSSFSAVCDAAVLSGKVEVLQWVRTKGFEWSEKTCATAAKAGYLEVLQYAIQNGCDWDQETCAQAAAFGQLEILKWARNQPDCPWNEVLIRQTASACQQNHVVAWIDSLQQQEQQQQQQQQQQTAEAPPLTTH